MRRCAFGIMASVISKLCHGRSGMSAALLIVFHERTGVSIAKLKYTAGYTEPFGRIDEVVQLEQSSCMETVS
jgi:hypothetical protein